MRCTLTKTPPSICNSTCLQVNEEQIFPIFYLSSAPAMHQQSLQHLAGVIPPLLSPSLQGFSLYAQLEHHTHTHTHASHWMSDTMTSIFPHSSEDDCYHRMCPLSRLPASLCGDVGTISLSLERCFRVRFCQWQLHYSWEWGWIVFAVWFISVVYLMLVELCLYGDKHRLTE